MLALGLPILGICYGLQFITHHLGGKVRPADKREYGHAAGHHRSRPEPIPSLPACPHRSMSGCPTATRPWSSPPAFPSPHAPPTPSPASPMNPPQYLGRAVPSRGPPHPRRARNCCATFVFSICHAAARLDPGPLHPVHRRRHPRTSGRRPRHLRPLRRRRFLRRRRAGRARHRRPPHLHLRQQRRAAQKRVRHRCRRPCATSSA